MQFRFPLAGLFLAPPQEADKVEEGQAAEMDVEGVLNGYMLVSGRGGVGSGACGPTVLLGLALSRAAS